VIPPGSATAQHGGLSPLLFRQALGRFAGGVTVITAVRSDRGRPEVRGMTANAFTSVSLDPPLVLVSISARARLDPWIASTGRYGVSVLTRQQESLARHFAGDAGHPELVRFVWRDGLPLVEDALVQLTCSVGNSYPAGDHTLHVARVESLWFQDARPLVFYAGEFCGLEPEAAARR